MAGPYPEGFRAHLLLNQLFLITTSLPLKYVAVMNPTIGKHYEMTNYASSQGGGGGGVQLGVLNGSAVGICCEPQ